MDGVFPVLLGIDLDAEALWEGKDPTNAQRPVLLSNGAFAVREGLEPLLELLQSHAIRTTFFVPGITCDRYPESVRAIVKAGHELGSHGYHHKPISPAMSLKEEEEELVRGIDCLRAITRQHPTAWRSPSWEWSSGTLDLLLSNGITVSTSFHDRIRPYRHERGGNAVDVVELPVQWHLADAPFFLYGGQVGRTIRTAAAAREVWEEEFAALYDRLGAFYNLTLHVQLIGHPGRLRMLDQHIAFIKRHPRARFMTCGEIAATVPWPAEAPGSKSE